MGRTVGRFVKVAGDDSKKYDAYVIREFIRQQARSRGGGLATQQRAASDIRSFVRFLTATGRCKSALEFAVPKIAVWRLSSLPKYIPARDVTRVIAAGRSSRDRAILLLLARLGLRAGDVAAMMLSDIDWQRASIRVSGKSRSETLLPLPQDVGDAMLDYIEHERPGPAEGRLFLTKVAPRGAISSTSVGSVVRWAIIRAGVVAPNYGSHLLRHSAAVEMLRQGVPLRGIGQVLRHRHLETTEIYAKVDFERLKTIVQPWPEVPR